MREHRDRLTATGEIAAKRRAQDTKWTWALVHDRLHARLSGDAATRKRVAEIERSVAEGAMTPTAGADAIAALLGL